MVARINGIAPTEYIEKISSVYLVERNADKSYIAYCEKFGVWKSDLSAASVVQARINKSISAVRWPERAFNEIGKVYWDSLTIVDIAFRPRQKPYKGGYRVVMDATAFCHCGKLDITGWVLLENVRAGHTKYLSSITHKPDDFLVSSHHIEYFADKTVTAMPVGYHGFTLDGKLVYVHRVVWTLDNGGIPTDLCVDHINRNKHDNRIENLRLVTHSQNNQNRTKIRRLTTSRQKGVYYSNGAWWARCKAEGREKMRGFSTEEAAIAAVKVFYAAFNREEGCIFSGHE